VYHFPFQKIHSIGLMAQVTPVLLSCFVALRSLKLSVVGKLLMNTGAQNLVLQMFRPII
jgi:hypothetical protein